MSYLKNTSGQFLYFTMIDASDGSAITSGTVTGRRSIDGGSQANVTGTISHNGNGQWQLAMSQADTNGDEIGFLFTHTSGIPVSITIVTDTKQVGDLNDLSAAEVNTEVDAALADYDGPTKVEMDAGFAALNDLSAADVNAEVVDALSVDTYAEPASVPAATASLAAKIGWLFTLARNKITQTATIQTLRNDADDGTIGAASVSDDGTTATRGEWS